MLFYTLVKDINNVPESSISLEIFCHPGFPSMATPGNCKLINGKMEKWEKRENRKWRKEKWKYNKVVKMKIENWKYDCVAHAMNMTLQPQ